MSELQDKRNDLLTLIIELLTDVLDQQSPDNEGTPLGDALESAQVRLEGLKGRIVAQQLEDAANDIREDADKLKGIAAEIKDATADLNDLSDKISSAASIASAVADLASGLA